MKPKFVALWSLFIFALCGLGLRADEGMWLFNQFPKQRLEKTDGFNVTDAFLDHLRLSAARFNSGGTGSFVSPKGLLFTNHHVAADCIQKVGSAEKDFMARGFFAAAEAEEIKCPDEEVNVLLRLEDVTAQVNAGLGPGMAGEEANRRRKANMSRLEKKCAAETGNRCDVVTLYSGAQYHLYQYKKYTDIRLVFAPEFDIAFFGGDPDNFTYPRYDLDIAFLRAYENGRPAAVEHYFRWSREGVRDGELTFVPGNPGSSARLLTVAQLEFERDYWLPLRLRRLESLIGTLQSYGAKSAEDQRAAREKFFSAQNSYKAFTGFLAGLRDTELIDRKREDERKLQAAVRADPKKRQEFGKVWDEVAAAHREYRSFYKPYQLLEARPGAASDLFRIARDVVRVAEERTKPDGERLREYADAARESLELALYSPAPITESLEITAIGNYFEFLRQNLGAEDPTVKALLGGKSPEQAARSYVTTSKLEDVAERKRLAGSAGAVKNSQDGMIRLALILDGPARRVRKQYEDRVESVLRTSAAKIAQARFAVFGANEYPDGTFTLRLAYAPVKGYQEKGKPVPYATTFEGLYRRATGKDPYRLPPRWIEAKRALNLKTPFNFVTTADIHGGNSGSATVNTKGEVVGIIFDSNIQGLPNNYVYSDSQARAVHVAGQGIVEALRKVYHAGRVLEELGMDRVP